MLKRFSAAKKLQVQSKAFSQNSGCWDYKGLNIKYNYRDPQKALPYPERRLLTYFA